MERVTSKLLFFLAIFHSFISLSGAVPSPWLAALRSQYDTNRTTMPSHGTTVNNSNVTVDFVSALSIADSVSSKLVRLSDIPAIALPPNISNYDAYAQLASLMPPLPAGTVGHDTAEVLAAIKASIKAVPSNYTARTGLTERQPGLRVMFVGDSMTQGKEGDWTWRYRMWQWFRDQGIAATFVGPYTGTAQPAEPQAPSPPRLYGTKEPMGAVKASGGYAPGASPEFDSHHFAVWGRAAAVDKGLIREVVAAHPPDLMLLMLGFNDLGWFYSDAAGTLDSMHTIINNARDANPRLKFAVANVPQRSFIGGRDDLPVSTAIYNSLLRAALPKWSTKQSPIHLVELQENYDCEPSACAAGYDGLHPNAQGEFQIARAFTLTLVNDFKIGSSALEVPSDIPSRSLPVPSNFKVVSSPGGVTATWDAVYGAHSYDVESRISGVTQFSAGSVPANRWDAHWTQDGWVYDVRVRASAGDTIKSDWTAVLSAKSTPKTAPAPVNVLVGATSTGFDVSWDPPTGPYTDSITQYEILYWDKDEECAFITSASFLSSPARIKDLVPGHRYLVAPITWNAAGGGFPKIVNSVMVGRGTPPPPSSLEIYANDPTTIELTWAASPNAAGYRLWSRNVNKPGSISQAQNNTVEMTCSDQYLLFPGTWNYEWCVSAYNGNAESAKGKCVLAPSPGPSPAQKRCPPPPEWCPAGSGPKFPGGGSGGSTPTGPDGPVPTDPSRPWPISTNGQCKGPDCKMGVCTGLLCVSFGCRGSDCLDGVCVGPDCIVRGCIGPGCTNGVCTSDGCVTSGCVGSDCNKNRQCHGDKCISLGCAGLDCDDNGVCNGPNCHEQTCSGPDCTDGHCTSDDCTGWDGCKGEDCHKGRCTGSNCSSCSGRDCHDGECTGNSCNGCTGSDCHNGHCTGFDCQSCTGRDCYNGRCTGLQCSSCVGLDCICAGSECGCKGSRCAGCKGPGCSCFGLACVCNGFGCTGCTGLGCNSPGRNGGGGGGGGGIDGCTGAGCGCSVSGGCHGGDKDGDRDGDNKPTSTASCIVKQTASICAEYCTVITDIAMATMTSCTSTACVPTIGCEPTGTTTTITSMSSDECLHVTPPATFPPNVDPYNGCAPCLIGKAIHGPGIIAQDNIIARDLSQPTYVSLHKRGAAETVTNIGSCTFAKGNSALAPAYTGATQYIAHAISNSLPKSQQMPRWYSKTDSDCVPVVTQVPDADVVGRNGNSKRPSIEHVYEKNWLGDFFKYLIQVQGWSCEEFQEHMFMPCNSLQLVYDGLASNRHWDFIGVTAELNIIKTAIGGNWEQDIITNADNALGTENTKITPHTPWAGAKGKLSERMLVLQRLVIACDIWTSDYTFNPLDRANSRIYSILFNINQPKLPVIYKYWMEHIRVGGVMAIAKKYVDLLVASIEDGLNNSAQKALEVPGGKETWDEWHTSLQRMKDVYKLDYLNDESVCTRPIKLTWKRVPLSEGSAGLGARDVCPLPSAPNTPTPTKATATMDEPPRTPENPSQTSRKPQDPPLPTEPSGGYYCFRDHNENKRWNSFGKEEASKLVVDLCSIADLLPTSNTFGYALRGNNGLVASVTWAQDQTGCSLKFDLPLNTYCAYMFKAMLDACGDLNSDKAYGGAFVDKSKYGCVTWWLGADSTASQDRLLTLGQQSRILTQPEKEAHREMLATLEPELPRLKKEVQG